MVRLLALSTALLCACASAQSPSLNPKVAKIVQGVSEDRITATLKKLESFGTRNTMSSQDDPQRGIGAARKWIYDELKGYSPRLQVRLDSYRVKKQLRITEDVEMSNIVAELPGTIHKDQKVIISAHYDSLVLRNRTESGTGEGAPVPAGQAQPAADPNITAPGVTDDGSGTAAVLELARVMSAQEYDKTLVFILFVAEEQGLIGSSLYAEKAHKANEKIEAVLNNDIIGSVASGDGNVSTRTVRIFSEDPADSGSRQLARYIKEVGERYVPSMDIDLVFRADRFGRGGDHTPFNQEGFSAVRVSSAEEDYSHQHTSTDTFDNTSVPYITRVARINGAVAATLALAPKSPVIIEEIERAGKKVMTPMIGRGKSRYDAQLRWKTDAQEADLAGYMVVMRSTTSPYWDRRMFVGKTGELLLPGVSIDEYIFGVQAIDVEGNASLTSVYTLPQREKRPIETY